MGKKKIDDEIFEELENLHNLRACITDVITNLQEIYDMITVTETRLQVLLSRTGAV